MKFLYALVGMKYHGSDHLVKTMDAGEAITLRRDKKNTHDPNAVAVWARKTLIAYVPRAQAVDLAKRMDAAGIETLYGRYVPSHRAVEIDDVQLKKSTEPYNDDDSGISGPAGPAGEGNTEAQGQAEEARSEEGGARKGGI